MNEENLSDLSIAGLQFGGYNLDDSIKNSNETQSYAQYESLYNYVFSKLIANKVLRVYKEFVEDDNGQKVVYFGEVDFNWKKLHSLSHEQFMDCYGELLKFESLLCECSNAYDNLVAQVEMKLYYEKLTN